jgi:hypothetical protein
LLTFGGGFLVTNGTISDGELQAVIGGVIAIGGVLWSIFAKRAAAPRPRPAMSLNDRWHAAIVVRCRRVSS